MHGDPVDNGGGDTTPEIREHIDRLHENMGHLERDGASLKDQVEELGIAFYKIEQRLARLESRLVNIHERLEQPDPGLEPPPHSAGPDIPRDPI